MVLLNQSYRSNYHTNVKSKFLMSQAIFELLWLFIEQAALRSSYIHRKKCKKNMCIWTQDTLFSASVIYQLMRFFKLSLSVISLLCNI